MKLIKLTLLTAAVAMLGGIAVHADDKPAAKPYPLKVCVVSDEKLGEHGKPYVFTYEGREVQLCCKDCLGDFKKEPAKFVKKLDDAAAKPAK